MSAHRRAFQRERIHPSDSIRRQTNLLRVTIGRRLALDRLLRATRCRQEQFHRLPLRQSRHCDAPEPE